MAGKVSAPLSVFGRDGEFARCNEAHHPKRYEIVIQRIGVFQTDRPLNTDREGFLRYQPVRCKIKVECLRPINPESSEHLS